MTTDLPLFIGFCIGVPGQSCGKRITEEDVMAVMIPNCGPIGDCCLNNLISASWGRLDAAVGAPKQEEVYKDPRRATRFAGYQKKSGRQWRNYGSK